MKVLVLGSRGMVGHVMTAYLEERGGFDVVNISRTHPFNERTVIMDLRQEEALSVFLDRHSFDAIINCAGILNRHADTDIRSAILINSYLPRYLEHRFRETSTRLIHISTDCVFSGRKGDRTESDPLDGDSIYARTKGLGELNNEKDLTLRLSVVGPDLRPWPEGEGLFNWFMAQKKEVPGFTKVFWTDLTSIELAAQVSHLLFERSGLGGIYHLVPEKKITKHALLKLLAKNFRYRSLAVRSLSIPQSDKSLRDTRKEAGSAIPSYERMVEDMRFWVEHHRAWYPHYG